MFTSPYGRHAARGVRAQGLSVTSATRWAAYKIAAAKGTTQELALSAMNRRRQIMRTEDDATAAAAYLSGQAELFATNTLLIPDMQKRNRPRSSR